MNTVIFWSSVVTFVCMFSSIINLNRSVVKLKNDNMMLDYRIFCLEQDMLELAREIERLERDCKNARNVK